MNKMFLFYLMVVLPNALWANLTALSEQQPLADAYYVQESVRLLSSSELKEFALLESISRVTVLGYVERPGIYFYEGEVSLFLILEHAEKVRVDSGRIAHRVVIVATQDEAYEVDYYRAKEFYTNKGVTPKSLILRGDAIVYRLGGRL